MLQLRNRPQYFNNAFETVSGLRVGVERIEGSVFGDLTLHGVTLSDPQGVFFRAPTAELGPAEALAAAE